MPVTHPQFVVWASLALFLINASLAVQQKDAPGIVVDITIASHYEFGELSFYEEHVLPANSSNQLILNNVGLQDSMGFGVVQVHAYLNNITLSYNSTIVKTYHENGTNLGLVVSPFVKKLFVFNKNGGSVRVSVSLIIYNKFVPVPGGCNLEFPIKTYPMLIVQTSREQIEVDTPPAFEITNTVCGKDNLTYETFYIRLARNDFTVPSYFDGLKKMMTGDLQKKYTKSASTKPIGGVKRFYNKEPGTGLIFVTVVSGVGGHSVYVPAITYSCAPGEWDGACWNKDVYTNYLSTLIIVFGAVKIITGCLIGMLDCCQVPSEPIMLVTTMTNGAFIGTFFSILILRFFTANFGSTWILGIITGTAAVLAILMLVLAIVLHPRISLMISNFFITLILSNVMLYAVSGASVTIKTMLVSLLITAVVTVLSVLPFIGAAMVLVLGVSVVTFGVSMLNRGVVYDTMLASATTYGWNSMTDMVI